MHEAFSSDQVLLSNALKAMLDELHLLPSDPLGADVSRLLHAPGKVLCLSPVSSRMPTGFWPLLSLAITRYCTPSAPTALTTRLALSCELLHSALDAFDEIEDDDSSQERTLLGDGRFLNAATTLSTLLPLILDGLYPASLSAETLRALQQLLARELLEAMRGQHRDILAEQTPLATFRAEESLAIAAAKSGTLFRLICRLSTMGVSASAELTSLFAQVGELMGVVAQLENDAHDLELELAPHESGGGSHKGDLRRGKKTLPIVLAHTQFAALKQNAALAENDEQSEQVPHLQRVAYDQAIKATLGAAEQLRLSALLLIQQIEQIRGASLPDGLRVLLNLDASYSLARSASPTIVP